MRRPLTPREALGRGGRLATALGLAALLGCATPAPDGSPAAAGPTVAAARPAASAASTPATVDLVPFASDEGLARLARSRAKVDFPVLANQYEAQLNAAFCGPTSAAIVLNAIHARASDLPRDHDRLHAGDLDHVGGRDPIVPRYTQDLAIVAGAKTRAQVLGEPVTIDGKVRRDFGYQLRQFDQMLRANGLATRMVVVDDSTSEAAIRDDFAAHLGRLGDYVLVNYRREVLGQQGGGHISPLGAYDAASDSFLILDVNPAAAGWVWAPAGALIGAMRTFDTVENRGYVVVRGR